MPDLEAEFRGLLTPLRIKALVEAHLEAYGRAVLHNSPGDGWDSQMFGFTIYKYVEHRLRRLPTDPNLGFELRSEHPAFRLGLGPFTLAAYCCGKSADDDINESFPNNEHGAPSLVDLNQYSLDLDDPRPVPRALVLAHFGNAVTGLEALYLAAPSSKSENRIDGWSYTKLLWKRDAGDLFGAPTPDLPRPTPIALATLSLKIPIEKRVGEPGAD